jgi:hypothetical protein
MKKQCQLFCEMARFVGSGVSSARRAAPVRRFVDDYALGQQWRFCRLHVRWRLRVYRLDMPARNFRSCASVCALSQHARRHHFTSASAWRDHGAVAAGPGRLPIGVSASFSEIGE